MKNSPHIELFLPPLNEIELEISRRQCTKSFAEFVRQGWHVLEPATELKWGWSLDAICDHLEAVHYGHILELLMNVPPGTMKSLLTGVFFPAWEWGPRNRPELRFLGTSHKEPLAIRDNLKCRRLITSEWYQARWPVVLMGDQSEKKKFENDKTGFREAMAFRSMTGSRGDRVLLDDPLSVDDAGSEAELERAEITFTESLPTRLNNEKSAKIVIMQRLHERDTSGVIIAKDLGYVHLMLPMEFEPERKCRTIIGFEDPRTELGELLFPERFPRDQVEKLKKTMGSYACNPFEAPVLMADLTLKPIGNVKVGDSIVGFEAGVIADGAGYARQRLRPAKVVEVFRRVAPVVKMRFDSGEVIRCTPDHRWYRRQRNDRPNGSGTYGPASIGSSLTRVCPPRLPDLSPNDQRLAGWLGGFFDGEGTVSFARRHGNCTPVSQIKFYQGAGRNGPLCDKLEQALTHFGFEYSISRDERKDPQKGVNYEYRCYTLSGKSLPLMQRFLHIVQPVKWRDRFIEGAFAAKFRTGFERVVSIEPDGEEEVFALKTETGNYVVWGLASSNCAGQFQQRPAPREGGMFKRSWFGTARAIPAGTQFVRGWDLAASTGQNAAYTAGAKIGRQPDGRYIIANCVRDRLSAGGVERLIVSTANADGVECRISLPQDPGQAGKSQAQYLVRQLAGFNARATPESGDKETRAEPLSAQAEAGNVDILRTGDPAKDAWIEPFLDELCVFPAGQFKDQTDAATRAFDALASKATPPTAAVGTWGRSADG